MNALIAQLLLATTMMLSSAMQSGNPTTMQTALNMATQTIGFVQESGAMNPTTPVYQDNGTQNGSAQNDPQNIGGPDLSSIQTATENTTTTVGSCTITAFQSTSTNYVQELARRENSGYLSDIFNFNPPSVITTVEVTLDGLPSSTIGLLSSIGTEAVIKETGGSRIVYDNEKVGSGGRTGTAYAIKYGNPYEGQFKTDINQFYPGGVHADFGNGVTCDYPMNN